MIKFLDLNRLNRKYLQEFQPALAVLVNEKAFILGDAVENFENQWADYTASGHAATTGSGFDAIYLIFEAYKLLGKLNPGDEVIIPAHTFIASILPVIKAGLRPVLTDPSDEFLLSAKDIEPKITSRTKAILPVHLYGRAVNLEEIQKLASAHDLLVIDDAAQAHGAMFHGQKIGGLTDATAWSFYPTKNLGGLGEGGAVTSHDEQLIETVKILRNYGQIEKYNSRYPGINSRMDSLQASFLTIKLKDLDSLNEKRKKIAAYYHKNINHPGIKKPVFSSDESHVFHQYVISSNHRDELRKYLKDNGIETLIHYPVPPHKQKALAGIIPENFPVSEQISRIILSLPMDPYLSFEELHYLTRILNAF